MMGRLVPPLASHDPNVRRRSWIQTSHLLGLQVQPVLLSQGGVAINGLHREVDGLFEGQLVVESFGRCLHIAITFQFPLVCLHLAVLPVSV